MVGHFTKKTINGEEINIKTLDINNKKMDFIPSKNSGLVHLAWQNLHNYNNFFHIEKNLLSNFNFIKNLVQNGVNHVLVTGTCFEYGNLTVSRE